MKKSENHVMEQNIMVRWKGWDPVKYPNVLWYIRGILPDRRFYGEKRHTLNQIVQTTTVDGKLSVTDYAEICTCVVAIQKFDINDRLVEGGCEGVVGLGANPSTRNIILRYSDRVHRGTEIARLFAKIIDILAPYIENQSNSG